MSVRLHRLVRKNERRASNCILLSLYLLRVAVVFAQFRYSFHAPVTLNRTRPKRSHHREKLQITTHFNGDRKEFVRKSIPIIIRTVDTA